MRWPTRWSRSSRARRPRTRPGRRPWPTSRTSPADGVMALLTKTRPPGAHAAAAGRPRGLWRHRFDLKASPYLYVAPFFLVFGTFGLFPLLYTGYLSLSGWREDHDGSEG